MGFPLSVSQGETACQEKARLPVRKTVSGSATAELSPSTPLKSQWIPFLQSSCSHPVSAETFRRPVQCQDATSRD